MLILVSDNGKKVWKYAANTHMEMQVTQVMVLVLIQVQLMDSGGALIALTLLLPPACPFRWSRIW